jgi:hypothetical protein
MKIKEKKRQRKNEEMKEKGKREEMKEKFLAKFSLVATEKQGDVASSFPSSSQIKRSKHRNKRQLEKQSRATKKMRAGKKQFERLRAVPSSSIKKRTKRGGGRGGARR